MKMKFTKNELEIINLISEFRNYDDLEKELEDNAVGVYLEDIVLYTNHGQQIQRR